ncbi:hypothetical protein AB3S75_008915 [Citrus x aurantiifolia]
MPSSSKSNAPKPRKRVDAQSASTSSATLMRGRDGSAFARCEECNKNVPVALISMHSCSLDAKIKMNLEAQVVEKPAEINKKKPAERKKPTSTEPRAKRLRKKDSDSNKPKRPPTAFFLFMDDFRKEYKEAHPDSKGVTGVAKEAGEKWKNMTDEEKKPYLDKAAELKADYSKAMEGNGDDNEVEDKADNEVEAKAENEDGDEGGSEKDVAEKEVQQDEENLDDY